MPNIWNWPSSVDRILCEFHGERCKVEIFWNESTGIITCNAFSLDLAASVLSYSRTAIMLDFPALKANQLLFFIFRRHFK
jgi:hypothetical protein